MRKIFAILFFVLSVGLFAQDSVQVLLPVQSTGVADFLAQHPEYDGRGTIVFIFDTGVDMGVDGLKQTSTGDVKVIDVRDFTGQGDIKYYEADIDDEDDKYYFENEDMEYKVFGADKLPLKAYNDKYYIGDLPETLWKNSGSGVTDVNGNGKRNDNFYFVVFEAAENDWVLFIDKNANGDLSDEKPIRNYAINHDTFTFKSEDDLPDFTIAVNIFPKESKVSFFFDDGSHGTHCAGIAAGYKIGGENLNGVAPGAQIIALKLGNNNYAGGATVTGSMRKCFEFADSVSKAQEKPCIVNMSFGIGSEIEGRAEMEKFIDKLVKNNPYLYICISNGNEGPGISTTGLPAASGSVLSSGAILTKEVGNNLYGTVQTKDRLTYFTSRGGEVMKPDVASPGACVSTVPNFSKHDRFWGTSMASPYSTGVLSLLMSAMAQEYPDVKIPSFVLYQAIREGAVPMDGYDYLDQGAGEINVVNAYNVLKKYIEQGIVNNYEHFETRTIATTMPNLKSSALYIRDGRFITDKDIFSFKIKRSNFLNKKKFYRIYKIKSSADWLKPVQRKIHFRNNQPAEITVRFDTKKMKEPGLYNAVITGYRADKTNFPEIQMMATVVIPYEFTDDNNYEREWKNQTVDISEVKRYFLSVPAGATSMKITLSRADKKYALMLGLLHDPDGRQIERIYFKYPDNADKQVITVTDLEPGVYEFDAFGYWSAEGVSTYNLSVQFKSAETIGGLTLSENHDYITVVNRFGRYETYQLKAKFRGYEKKYVATVKAGKNYELPVVFHKGEKAKSFKIWISKEDFNKTTDFAMMLNNSKGKSVALGGLSYQEDVISYAKRPKDDSTFTLVLAPAFALDEGEITVHITERTNISKRMTIIPSFAGSKTAKMYPQSPINIDFRIKKPKFDLPENAVYAVDLYFKQNDENVQRIPIKIK